MPTLAALIWAAWILYLGTDDRRRVVGFGSTASEALQHILAFAVLAALVKLATRWRPGVVFGVVAVGGVVGEFVQLTTADRTFGVADMVFSVIGAALGALVLRRTGWGSMWAVLSVAVLLIASAPITLDVAVVEIDTSFPVDCAAAPPLVGGDPETVLEADFTDAGDALPIRIEEPTTAAVRDRLVETSELSAAVEFSTTSLDQEGPVRLFTISNGAGADEVDFHIGLENDDLSVRLRTSCDIFNSIVVSDAMTEGARHRVVVTWGAGRLEVWVDAVKAESVSLPWGDLERWDPDYPITVGDEAGGGRRFEGVVHSVTMWDRALDDSFIVAGRGGAESAP